MTTTVVECEACAGTGRYGFRDDDECPKCHGGGSNEEPMTKHVLSPNPHPLSTAEARAWGDGYSSGRRDVVEQYGGHAVASRARDMARLMLTLQWAGAGFRDEGNIRHTWSACPSCYARKPDGHAASCELAAVLRAAGVLP